MNTRQAKLLILATLTATAATFATPVLADNCTTQYGNGSYGTTTCTPTDFTINKLVKDPINNNFVENLGSTDATFSPDGDITFRLDLHNTSNQNFDTVTIKDTFPQHVINGSVDSQYNGSYNANDHTLIFTIKDFKANESRSVEVRAKVTNAGTFPKDKDIICEVNKGEFTAQDRHDEDTAQFCVRTNVLGTTSLPTAGPEDYLPLLPFIALAITGMGLIFKRRALL